MYAKEELRREFRLLRAQITEREAKEKAVRDKLIALCDPFESVFIYVSMGSETDTRGAIAAMRGKSVLVPFTPPEGPMRPMLLMGDGQLDSDGRGNIANELTAETNVIPQVVVVPMLAFNGELFRLGYGGGYYDRYLICSEALKVGLAFDEQYTDKLSPEPFDIPLDLILTPSRTLKSKTMPGIISG